MKIIVATDSFKGSISAKDACGIIADTIAEKFPDYKVVIKPMADGGEGTGEVVMANCSSRWISQKVMGPLPDMRAGAGFVWLENSRTVLVEMALASGITLLNKDKLNPMLTTTYGTGQLIKKALEKKPSEILLAIGGSATVDMGVGAAMALGWQFLDSDGKEVCLGGAGLEKIEKIIVPDVPIDCKVKVLSDVSNPLCGSNGAAEVFGPQKGATPKMVESLDIAMRRLAGLIEKKFGKKIADIAGAGAAGGFGAGALAFMNAEIVSGIDAVIEVSDLRAELADADWIITGEGKFDSQSLNGKVISGIVKAAKKTDTKVAVIAGDVQLSRAEYQGFGISEAISLKADNMTTEYAMTNCEQLLRNAANDYVLENL